MAMDPNLAAQVKALVTMELEQQKDQKGIELSRKLRVDQKKAGFKNAADKRAVGFLYDLKFDVEDFFLNYKKVLNQDEQLLDVAENAEEVKKFLEFAEKFGNMLNRKITKEVEAYQVAKSSRYGWLAEKFFRQSETFSDFDTDAQKWYEVDEPSADDKVKKLRQAEKQAALELRQKKSLGQEFDHPRGRKRSRWSWDPAETATSSSSSSAASVSSQDGLQNLYQPPTSRPGLGCHYCGELGHFIRHCPKKPAKN